VVCHRSLRTLAGKWHEGAFSFSGSGSQYITNGPQILAWEGPNRLVGSNGLWWRPDQWQYRLRLRVASEAGLKSVTVHDGDREVFRRWLPGGAKNFEQELVLSNCQQRGFTLVAEDVQGRRAVSMSFWNRNLNMEEFFCSDRCNFLGSARLRTKAGNQYWTPIGFSANMGVTPSKGRLDMSVSPAVGLTANSPTLPIDGAPAGFPTAVLRFGLNLPKELTLFAYPQTYMVGPEIAVGQGDIRLGFDPAEVNAKTSPLGHAYEQPQDGSGNAWGGWYRLIPTRHIEGRTRTYAANWLTRGFRLGWHETQVKVKEPIKLEPGKGIQAMYVGGEWKLHVGGKPATAVQGKFERGTLFTLENLGGSVVLAPMEGPLEYRWHQGRNGGVELYYMPGKATVDRGETIAFRVAFAGAEGGLPTEKILGFASAFGALTLGKTAYAPQVTRGKPLDNYLLWRVDAQGEAVEARIPKTDLPGFLTACIENLRDHWSVYLVDRARSGPNFRALPVRDGRSFAQLDLTEADSDLFLGHPVVADNPAVKLLVSWQELGVWFIEAHNPTDAPLTARLSSAAGWPMFRFQDTVTLPPGTSQFRRVQGQ
jgi:transposase